MSIVNFGRDIGNVPTKVAGPSTRGGRPVNLDMRKGPGVVKIDPGSAHAVDLDFGALNSQHVGELASAINNSDHPPERPADLAHGLVQELAHEQQRRRANLEFFATPTRAPEPTTVTPIAIPAAAEVAPRPVERPRAPAFQIVFERANGDAVESSYDDVIIDADGFLTLARDRTAGPVSVFRPGPSEEPFRVTVTRVDQRPARSIVLMCLPTGFRLAHRGWEYVVFVVQPEEDEHG
jgi:hypothetical protein